MQLRCECKSFSRTRINSRDEDEHGEINAIPLNCAIDEALPGGGGGWYLFPCSPEINCLFPCSPKIENMFSYVPSSLILSKFGICSPVPQK